MTRLPSVGGDDGKWGQILNDFLLQAHNADGTLRAAADIAAAKTAAESAVQTVNGKGPNTAGAVGLTVDDLGAEPAGLSNETQGALSATYVVKGDPIVQEHSASSPVLWLTESADTLDASQPDIARHVVNGTVRSWLNEWGALRGRNPYSNWADALVRAQRYSGDNGNGNAFEINDAADGSATVTWGRRWDDGSLNRNGVRMADAYICNAGASLPSSLPAGTLVVRTPLSNMSYLVRYDATGYANGDTITTSTTSPDVTPAAVVGTTMVDIEGSETWLGHSSNSYVDFTIAVPDGFGFGVRLKTPSAWASGQTNFLYLLTSAGGVVMSLSLTGSFDPGRLRVYGNSGNLLSASTPNRLSTSTEYRVAGHYKPGTGELRWAIYDVSGVSVYDSGVLTGLTAAGDIATARFGLAAGAALTALQTRQWRISNDTTTLMAPDSGAVPGSVSVWTGSTEQVVIQGQ